LLSSKSAVCELGLEGIVSKKLSAPYHGSFGPGEKGALLPVQDFAARKNGCGDAEVTQLGVARALG
jgi:hypothetical protein